MGIARRDFLKSVGGVTLAGGLFAGTTPRAAEQPAMPAFAFADDRVPMNAANLCPMPNLVSAAVRRLGADLDRDMSGPNRRRIESMKEEARARIAALLGVGADEIAIVRNTSEANNTIVQGFPARPGDEILLWDQNHPSNGVAWDVIAARAGCSVRRFSVAPDAASVDRVVDLFKDAIGPKTRVVSFTHISNITGFRLPAREICEAIRNRGDIYIHIDGAQTWGAAEVNLRELGCDSFSGSAHKWFMGPRETGILYVHERSIERIWPNVVSVPWGDEAQTSQIGARKFEAFGQRNDAGIAALVEAARMHEAITPAGIERRSMAISDYLREGLADLGVPMLSPAGPPFASSVVILKAAADNAAGMVDEVLKDSGVIGAAVNGFRLSPHIYNTRDHIDRVLASIGRFRNRLQAA
ncbi:MAG: aminotransferase class V-fold PLP-dependent enzyme [Woeseiaceae bacterium]